MGLFAELEYFHNTLPLLPIAVRPSFPQAIIPSVVFPKIYVDSSRLITEPVLRSRIFEYALWAKFT
jgi:hypothetical protein